MRIWLVVIMLLVPGGCIKRLGDEPDIFDAVRQNDSLKLFRMLEQGADPNRKNGVGEALLHAATGARGGLQVTRILVLAGADLDIQDDRGRTPLHNAAGWCSVDIVALLVNAGANLDVLDDRGRSALDATCVQPADKRQETIRIFRQAFSR